MERLSVKIKSISIFSLYLFFLLFLGCAGSGGLRNTSLDLPEHSGGAGVRPPVQSEKPLEKSSSLWQESSSFGHLFTDPRARGIGDIITVNIIEKASASGNASTKADKKSSHSAGITSLFGFEKALADKNPNLDPGKLLGASTDNSFDSSGEISRSGNVTATLTARVTELLPNANLMIRGTRQVTINNEQQLLIIQGIIRPEDISPENTIASTSIADAQIIYTGKGIVSDRQRPGWLGRVVDLIWPF